MTDKHEWIDTLQLFRAKTIGAIYVDAMQEINDGCPVAKAIIEAVPEYFQMFGIDEDLLIFRTYLARCGVHVPAWAR